MKTSQAIAKRVLLEGLGWVLLVVGIAALVLPGPGLLAMFAGVALLSQQYDWADKRVEPIRLRALRSAAEGVQTVPRIIGSSLGVLLLVAAGALWILSPPAPGWWPLRDSWWLLGGVGTGVVQIASAIIAAAMLVYSYRRFHGHDDAVEQLSKQIDEADDAAGYDWGHDHDD